MSSNWLLNTHGDPLAAVRDFLKIVWEKSNLDKMLVPTNGSPALTLQPSILDNPHQLVDVNPFKPLMTSNTARFIPDFVGKTGNGELAAMLRPCEMRAFVEMTKHTSISKDHLLTICVDCLGTYPLDEYQWRAERKGSKDGLDQEMLKLAKQGGLVPYRYRSACQMCGAPDASDADINLGVLGLPVRNYILINIFTEEIAQRLHLSTITEGEEDGEVVRQRERMVAKLVERNNRVRERIRQGLTDILPSNVSALISQLAECDPCQKCLEICPICYINYPRKGEDGKLVKDDIIRWLISCAGCGMCEQACPRHQPLSAIFTYIRQQLVNPLGHIPEHSF